MRPIYTQCEGGYPLAAYSVSMSCFPEESPQKPSARIKPVISKESLKKKIVLNNTQEKGNAFERL